MKTLPAFLESGRCNKIFEMSSLRNERVGANEQEDGLITDVDGRDENVRDKIEDVHG